jgi:hypothetical protein
MSETPDIHGFPASKLGDFLRAMADPEGIGALDAEREREITRIEERLAAAIGDPPDSAGPAGSEGQ